MSTIHATANFLRNSRQIYSIQVLVEGVPATKEAVCRAVKLFGHEQDSPNGPVFAHNSPYDMIDVRLDKIYFVD